MVLSVHREAGRHLHAILALPALVGHFAAKSRVSALTLGSWERSPHSKLGGHSEAQFRDFPRAGTLSVARLIHFLTALAQDVEITVRPTHKEHGEVSVVL
jgi:hypothetical protein